MTDIMAHFPPMTGLRRKADRLPILILLLLTGLADHPAAAATPLHLAQAAPSMPAPPPSPVPASPPVPAKGDGTAPASLGTPATVIDGQQAASLLGKQAQSPTGDDMGRIVDVIVDNTGRIRAAVIDFGGFLGVGSRKIAVDWRSIHFPASGNMEKLVVDLKQDQLRLAPIYKDGEPVVVLGPTSGAGSAANPADASALPKP